MLKVILNRKAIEEAGAEESQRSRGAGKNQCKEKKLILGSRSVSVDDDGEVYLYEGNLNYKVPDVFVPFIDTVSYYDNFGNNLQPKRQVGEYRLGSAFGELKEVGGSHYHLELQAESFKELRELYHLIREGKVWPVKDYEAVQVPRPCLQLRNLLKEAWQLIRRDTHDQLYRIKNRVIKSVF